MNVDERRAWLFPRMVGRRHGIDLSRLDPDDEDDRRILIEAEHPELADALERGLDELVVEGQPTSPRMHVAMHGVVASQLWHDEPPEMWSTAERLVSAGYDRHEVLHMLGSVAVGELWLVWRSEEPFDRERYAAALAELPESWSERLDDDQPLDWPDDDGFEFPRLPEGTTLTHRLTEAEIAGGFVAYAPDLEPLSPLLANHGHLHLAGDAVAEPEVVDDREVLVGPPGWLGEVRPGGLLGFRISGDHVDVVPVDAAPGTSLPCERLRSAFDGLNEGDGMPVPVAELLAEALADQRPAAPAILPPVGELLPGCGFEIRAGDAAPEGADWETFGRLRATAVIAAVHGLDPGAARALVVVSELYRLVAGGEVPLEEAEGAMVAEVGEMLADPRLGRAFIDVAQTVSDGPALDRFLEQVLRGTERGARGGLTWTMSVAARAAGDHDRVEALLRRALEADPHHPEALDDAAWYASDRGDARRAMELLRRLWELVGEGHVDQRAAVLQRYARPLVALAGRNDPCPCGSGRKYKHCCQRKATLVPLAERVGWVWEKLEWFLAREGYEDHLDTVLDAFGYEAEHETLAPSLVLFSDRAVEDFLTRRGPLLPDDERNLVAQWALVDRSVHEVVAVEPGAGLTTRDVRSGETVDVQERLGSGQLAVGDLIFAHVVPDGAGHQIVGGVVTVPLRLRDPLLELLDDEPDAVDIADLLAAATAPPEILTMEGEPVVLCEARYQVGDLAALASLDKVLARDDELTWSEAVEVDRRPWIRGTVAVDGAELVVTANSEARFGRLCRAVESAVPGLELLAQKATPAADLIAARGSSSSLPLPQAVPPEAADAVAAFLREQEDRWIDERIPALGGLTPREAAHDPTRREQLEALLHEFDRRQPPPGALTLDTGHIRTALGLDG
ncbi:MAG: DUF1841 family protein [Acidimicrobiales bacterium]